MKKPKQHYLVMALEKTRPLSIGVSVDLIWADGMVGVCPVFGTKKAAQKYAGKNYTVLPVTPEELQ